MRKMSRSEIGKKAKLEGDSCEEMFEDWCEKEGYKPIRIHNGGYATKTGKFYRVPQICDYILIKKSTTHAPEGVKSLVDVKKFTKRKLTKSYFYQGKRKNPTSTQRQASKMLSLYKEWKLFDSYFHFVSIEDNKHYYLTIADIACNNFELRPFL